MLVPKERMVAGLGEFMRLDLFPAMPDGFSKFAANMVLSAFRANPDNFIRQYLPFAKMLGATEDGTTFDIDVLAQCARDAMQEAGKVSIAGFTLDMPDLNKLIGRIQNG